jgi:hypothetical protein
MKGATAAGSTISKTQVGACTSARRGGATQLNKLCKSHAPIIKNNVDEYETYTVSLHLRLNTKSLLFMKQNKKSNVYHPAETRE